MARRATFVGSLLVLLAACASPTLPLPPPLEPTVSAGTDVDHVKLSSPCGSVEGNALVVTINTNPSVPGDEAVGGAIASACGSWDATIYGHSGDTINVSQEVGGESSQVLSFQLP